MSTGSLDVDLFPVAILIYITYCPVLQLLQTDGQNRKFIGNTDEEDSCSNFVIYVRTRVHLQQQVTPAIISIYLHIYTLNQFKAYGISIIIITMKLYISTLSTLLLYYSKHVLSCFVPQLQERIYRANVKIIIKVNFFINFLTFCQGWVT